MAETNQYDLAKAEATSDHLITAIWRPVCSVIFVLLIIAEAFGWCTLNEKVHEITELLLGVYAGSRGLEKVTKYVRK